MNTIKVNFFIDYSRKNAEGLSPIRVRSKHNSSKLIIKSTGLFSTSEKWDNKKGTSKDSFTENQLLSLKTSIKNAYSVLARENPGVTLNDVWDRLSGNETERPRTNKVVDWIDFYLNNSPYSTEYLRGAYLLKYHLTGIRKGSNERAKGSKPFAPNLTFSELNQTKINALCKHIVDQGKLTATAVKVVKFLKQVAKMAADHKVNVGNLNFRAPKNYIKKTSTQVRLTIEEILKINSVELDKAEEIHIRDMFVFLCMTGLRHSDLIRLTPTNLIGDFILFNQKKTGGDEVAVTLNKVSRTIAAKYAKGKKKTEILFPEYSQQFFNRVIKAIARRAGLKEGVKGISYSGSNEIINEVQKFKLIKTHTGRRSFSRLLSIAGIAEELIAEEMGHNTTTITRHYIGNSEHRQRIRLVQTAWENILKR